MSIQDKIENGIGLNVLSLFDGMSCGQIALDRLGIKVENYFASEIKPHAIKCTLSNYPDTVHIGDVRDVFFVKGEGLYFDLDRFIALDQIDLVIGGSPCQDFSFLKSSITKDKGYGLQGEKSKLFYEFDRLRKECAGAYFLMENVRMKKESEHQLNDYLGVEALHINSNLVSAQNRHRLYWTNIPQSGLPEDRGVSLQDILETDAAVLKPFKVNYTPSRVKMWEGKCKNITSEDKSGCLTTKMDRWNNAGLIAFEDFCRFLTPTECERLQTVPEGYTNGLTKNQRWDLLGDGWTVDVICHILSPLDPLI